MKSPNEIWEEAKSVGKHFRTRHGNRILYKGVGVDNRKGVISFFSTDSSYYPPLEHGYVTNILETSFVDGVRFYLSHKYDTKLEETCKDILKSIESRNQLNFKSLKSKREWILKQSLKNCNK
jgi:hypothetical protein